MNPKNVAVVGVGAVGVEILRVLKVRKFPIKNLRVFARTAREIDVDGAKYKVEAIEGADFSGIEIALFAGTEGEKGAATQYAEKFIKAGAVVIDNGADYRMKTDVPLVVPEVNKDKVKLHKGIIANPNCTTIQAMAALAGIYKVYGLEKIILTSFQAVSGAGKIAMVGLWEETKELVEKNTGKDFDHIDRKVSKPKGFNHQIAFNVIPQIGDLGEEKFTSEEWKVVKESHKILNDHSIRVSATCARVPVLNCHSEAIYITLRNKATVADLEAILKKSENVTYLGDKLAMPIDCSATVNTYVSRLRKDPYEEKSFWLWVVADNLWKGAALNAVQIAECL
jgi:aspartate-semialdehyde dehydrogenase